MTANTVNKVFLENDSALPHVSHQMAYEQLSGRKSVLMHLNVWLLGGEFFFSARMSWRENEPMLHEEEGRESQFRVALSVLCESNSHCRF